MLDYRDISLLGEILATSVNQGSNFDVKNQFDINQNRRVYLKKSCDLPFFDRKKTSRAEGM